MDFKWIVKGAVLAMREMHACQAKPSVVWGDAIICLGNNQNMEDN